MRAFVDLLEDKGVTNLLLAFGTVALAVIAWAESKRSKQEMFVNALQWLGGGSQQRNVGLAIIEANLSPGWWEKQTQRLLGTNRMLLRIYVPLLIGSAIYLLLESDHPDASHELYNLKRLMILLLRDPKQTEQFRCNFECLRDAVVANKAGAEDGLDVPADCLKKWNDWLTTHLGVETDRHGKSIPRQNCECGLLKLKSQRS